MKIFAIVLLLVFAIVIVLVSFKTGIGSLHCKKCGGEMHRSGSILWNEGSKYQVKEKFWKCENCGRVVSNQWD